MRKYNEYFEKLAGRNVDVIGLGVSNLPLIKILCNYDAKVTICDKNENVDRTLLEKYDVSYKLGEDYLENLAGEVIFRTPGLNYFDENLEKAKENGSIITSEMEVFFEVCPCKIIAITGSDGKTTTTTIIQKILEQMPVGVFVGGNIGTPLLEKIPKIRKEDFCVVELSSFQLMSMKKSPNVALITNITPNHLDMHKDMTEYVESKLNITKFQDENDKLILNLDDEISKNIQTKADVQYFSMKEKADVYLSGDDIIADGEFVMKKSDILLAGEHNIANYLSAIAVVKDFVSYDCIVDVAKTFNGVTHRMEFVREFDGVKYYNDSIASSPTRAIAGLKAFSQKIVLIAGGYDKNLDYAPLAPIISEQVSKLVLVGATAEKILKEVRKINQEIEIFVLEDFTEAIKKSREISVKGDIVMMSPASASFDLFKNFMERGAKFKEIVNDFK